LRACQSHSLPWSPERSADQASAALLLRRPGQQDGGLLQRGDAVPQARGQHLRQLRQGTDRSLGDPGDPADGGGAQGDHYGGRFLVIEQKARQRVTIVI